MGYTHSGVSSTFFGDYLEEVNYMFGSRSDFVVDAFDFAVGDGMFFEVNTRGGFSV